MISDVYEDVGIISTNYTLISDDEEIVEENVISTNISMNEANSYFSKGQDSKESLSDRYLRLVKETDALALDLKCDASDLTLKVTELQRKLKHIYVSQLANNNNNISNLHLNLGSLEKNNNRHIDNENKNYKIVYNAEDQQVNQELEARIAKLERIIGIDLDPIDSIESKRGFGIFQTSSCLIDALERLDQHLSVLAQPEAFELCITKIKESSETLERAIEIKRKQKIESSINGSNISSINSDKEISFIYGK